MMVNQRMWYWCYYHFLVDWRKWLTLFCWDLFETSTTPLQLTTDKTNFVALNQNEMHEVMANFPSIFFFGGHGGKSSTRGSRNFPGKGKSQFKQLVDLLNHKWIEGCQIFLCEKRQTDFTLCVHTAFLFYFFPPLFQYVIYLFAYEDVCIFISKK